MTGGESITFRHTAPAQTQARTRQAGKHGLGGEEFVIDQLDKLELGPGGGVTRLQDSAHLQVMSALSPSLDTLPSTSHISSSRSSHLGLVLRSL